MTKHTFLDELCRRLRSFPPEEAEKAVSFYTEAIDDRLEDGMTEEEAVASLGSLDEIVAGLTDSLPLSRVVKKRVEETRQARTGTGWRVTAILGAPLWVPLLIAAAAVVLAFLISFFAVMLSAFIVLVSLMVSGAAAIAGGVLLPYGTLAPRLMLAGAGVMLIGGATALWPLAEGVEKAVLGALKRVFRALKARILAGGEAA